MMFAGIMVRDPFPVMARLDRVICLNAMERAMTRSSRVMTGPSRRVMTGPSHRVMTGFTRRVMTGFTRRVMTMREQPA
jgi:hypothetical protein